MKNSEEGKDTKHQVLEIRTNETQPPVLVLANLLNWYLDQKSKGAEGENEE